MISSIESRTKSVVSRAIVALDAVGHRSFKLFQGLADCFAYSESVCPRLLVDGDNGSRCPVHPGIQDILLATDFNARDVLDPDNGAAVLAGAQNNVSILPGLDEGGLGHDRECELHVTGVRLLTDLACAIQGVLAGTAF